VDDALEREVSLLPGRAQGRLGVDDTAPRSPGFVRITSPTRADPAITMMPDQSSFCCWVEPLSDGDRWVFLSPDGATYVGPAYAGENSLEQIGGVLSGWLGSNGLNERFPP